MKNGSATALCDRRAWLLSAALAGMGIPCFGQEPKEVDADEEKERESIEQLAKQAGLRPFRSGRTSHFVGLGDAPDSFRSLTLRDCEAVAADYLDHYRTRGFKIEPPPQRLTVVVLADDRSFAAFLGDPSLAMIPMGNDSAPSVHGVYSRTSNRLVVFDHRPLGRQLAARPGADNLRSLAHEVTHQLTYNTGLLDRHADVPACVVEGLAMYGEVRQSTGRTPPGQLNRMRLKDLTTVQRRRIPWVPVAELLAHDRFLKNSGPHETLLAYAESWLLIHLLMKDPARLPGFQAYLDAIRDRRDADGRLEDARKHLGDLDRLNDDLRRYSVRLLKN